MTDKDEELRSKHDSDVLENLEMFRSLYENSPLGYQSLDDQGNFIIVNKTWLDLLGYSNKDEIIGNNFGDYITERDLFAERFPTFKACGVTNEVLFEMRRKDGSHILVSIDGRVSYDKDGKFIQTHCLLHDVTEKSKADESLKESEEKYRTLFERDSDAIFIFDPDTTNILDANKATSEMYGYDKDELIGMSCLNFSAEVEKTTLAIDKIRETGNVNIQYRLHKKKDGTAFPVNLSGYKAILSNKDVMFVVAKDVTEQKKTEEELRRYEHIVSSSIDMMALLDKNFIYLAVNNSYENKFGIPRDKIIGRSASELFGQDVFEKVIKPNGERCMAGEEVSYHDWFDFPLYGSQYLEVIYTPYIGPDKEIVGFVVNGRDITDKKKAEDELRARTEELEKINRAFVGRELKMMTLKKEIEELKRINDNI